MEGKKLKFVAALVLFAALAKTIGATAQAQGAAQEPIPSLFSGNENQALGNDNNGQTNSLHHDKRENGPLAVSAVQVIDEAYASNQIATLSEDGGPYNFLTNFPNGAFNPVFSRDGSKLIFWAILDHTPDGIFSVPVEGGVLTQIHTDCGNDPSCFGDDEPAISPDNREFLAVRFVGPFDDNGCLAFAGIFKFHADGSHPQQLSPSGAQPCTGDDEPHWSPDARKIVFRHADVSGLFSLWVMRRDGSCRHQITPAGMDVGDPDWSPDGALIVFQSPAEPADDQTPQQIFTIHPDGTQTLQITHYEPTSGVTIKTNGARWSPDGQKLVFAHSDISTTIGPDGQPHADLFVMNADGSNVIQVNFTPEKDNSPAWGPRR
jgi:Tol biopolymer transport system component